MMKIFHTVLLVCLLGVSLGGRGVWAQDKGLEIDQFGTGRIFVPNTGASKRSLSSLVVVLSPSDGWDKASEDFAKKLQADGSLVLGLDVAAYKENKKKTQDMCLYPSGLIEDAVARLQKEMGLDYTRPVLIGLGDSGGLAAVTAAQTLAGTYEAVIAPDFCERVAMPKPLCLGEMLEQKDGAYALKVRNQKDGMRFYLAADQQCLANKATWRVSEPVMDYSDFARKSLKEIEVQKAQGIIPALAQEPLVYIKGQEDNPWLIVFYSGDGGWRDIDRQIGKALQDKGYSILGVDSLRAFWRKQKPEEVAKKLQLIIEEGKRGWRKSRVAVIGYSFGADILPFVVPLLKEPRGIDHATFLMLGREASFEITVGAYFGKGDKSYNIPLALERWPSIPSLCFYGRDEVENTSCLKAGHNIVSVARDGGHHFDKNYKAVADRIAEALAKMPVQ